MISFGYQFLQNLRGATTSDPDFDKKKELNDILNNLHQPEQDEKIDTEALEKKRQSDAIKNENCIQKQGIITSLSLEDGNIDEHLHFTKTMANPFFEDLRVGAICTYLAYKTSDDMPLKLVKILAMNSEMAWDINDTTEEINMDISQTFYNTHLRIYYGTVTDKHRSILTVLTGNDESITVDLDVVKNNCNFIIVKGDLLKMTCQIQTDSAQLDFNGEILEIVAIAFQMYKTEINCVTHVCQNEAIIGDGNVYFIRDSASMHRGDVVEFEAIESDQNIPCLGKTSWRVVNVKSFKKRSDATSNVTKVENFPEVSNDKYLQLDPPKVHWDFKKVGEVQQQKVKIINNSKVKAYLLMSFSFSNKKDVWFVKDQQVRGKCIDTGESLELKLEAKCQLYGTYQQKLTIQLNSATINIPLLLSLDEGEVLPNVSTTSCLNKKYNSDRMIREMRSIDIVPGEKVTKNPRFMDKRISENPVPNFLREIILGNGSYLSKEEAVKAERSYAFDQLTEKNYYGKFKLLVHLEELACEEAFKNYEIERAHFRKSDGFLKLMIKGVSERRPSITIGDSVRIIDPFAEDKDRKEYEGWIHKVLSDSILLKFHERFHSTYNGTDYKIRFVFSRANYKKQSHALDIVVKDVCNESSVGIEFVFPKKIVLKEPQVDVELSVDGKMKLRGFGREFPWFNNDLNTLQKQAVVNILRGDARPIPYIVFGPPGTGKTMTIVETILQIASLIPTSRILVGAPSNSSANLITELLVKSNALTEGEFLRLVSYNQIEKELIPEHLARYCGTLDIAHENGTNNQTITTESGLKLKVQKSLIGRCKVTISTLVTLGSLMHLRFRKGHFSHIVIDEAGQSVETETLIPITFLTKDQGQVVLAGDPEQLGPIISSKLARKLGFDKSFLERLLEQSLYLRDTDRFETGYNDLLVTKLLLNYRSLPTILAPFNEFFYHGELKAVINPETSPEAMLLKSLEPILWNQNELQDRNCGLFFVNVNGQNRRSQDSPSWFNGAEAKNVFQFLIKLYNSNVKASDIGIITPYNQQVRIIRGLITEANLDMPKVGSVEEFQGQERKIIMISTVRTTDSLIPNDLKFGLGFVNCVKRLNVSISRARALLVIFGHQTSLYNNDNHWKMLIDYAKQENTYHGM